MTDQDGSDIDLPVDVFLDAATTRSMTGPKENASISGVEVLGGSAAG